MIGLKASWLVAEDSILLYYGVVCHLLGYYGCVCPSLGSFPYLFAPLFPFGTWI